MIYKKGRYYMVKFMGKGGWLGVTRATNARRTQCAAKIRSELAEGNWGIFQKKLSPP